MTTRLKQFLQIKSNPHLAILKHLEGADAMAEKFTRRAVEETLRQITEDFKRRLEELAEQLENSVPEVSKQIVANGIQRFIEQNAFRFRGEKGDSIKGDKGDSIKGDSGKTPVPGIDYPTEKEFRKMITELIPDNKPLIEKLIKSYKEEFPTAEKIARLLEKLQGKEKLDYYALKNLPTIPQEVKEMKGVARGGGEKTYYYDLSSLCNGTDKVFTIPSNKRVLGVYSTQFPVNYRPLIDWTGSGTTTLTLTSEVSAPATGQTLYILYVP